MLVGDVGKPPIASNFSLSNYELQCSPTRELGRPTLNVVAIGLTSGCQCVVEQLDAVLAPEHLAVEHVAGRAERIDLECFFNILLVPLFNALALGVRKEFLCRKSDAIGEHNERLLVGKISLISPYSRK